MAKIVNGWTLSIAFIALLVGIMIWNRSADIGPGMISRTGIHWHPHLSIKIRGQQVIIPLGVGLQPVENAIHIHDLDNINIKNYSCYSLPAFILINSKREIILQYTGEADFEEIEQTLLQELKLKGEITKISPQIIQEHHFYSPEISPLTSAGSHGNPVGLGSHLQKTPHGEEYTDSARHHLHTIYLHGPWTQKREFLEFIGKSFGYITYPYYAKEVHISLGGLGIAEIFYNDQPLTKKLSYSSKETDISAIFWHNNFDRLIL